MKFGALREGAGFMYVHRQLEKEMAPFLKRREVLAIVGPRQAGKTTFIEFLENKLIAEKKKVKFITFEKRADLELFQNSIEDFKDLYSDYYCVIIDEFQYAKDGGQKLKYLYDTTKIKFIVSGSSSLDLFFQTGKYMVGRMIDFKLIPFSFREFLSFQDQELYNLLSKRLPTQTLFNFDIKNGFNESINQKLTLQLEQYAVYGGYPAVAMAATTEKQKILEGISEKYLLKEIKGLLNLATDDELVKLSKFLSSQIGNLIKYEELSNSCGLPYRDLLKHLNILEKTYIIKLIKPYCTNKRTELSKNPKIYFLDLGLRNFLLSDFRQIHNRNDMGAIIENCAFNMLDSLGLAANLKYWRSKSKAEVDFVIEKEQNIFPIEIKYSSRQIIGKSLYSFIEKFKLKKAVILTKDYLGEKKINSVKIQFIPLSYF